MKRFLFLLLVHIAVYSSVPTLLAALGAEATTCGDCIAQQGCTFSRIGEDDNGNAIGHRMCDFMELFYYEGFTAIATCQNVEGGTSVTPAITTQGGCDYFNDSTISCENCASRDDCVFCSSSGVDGTQSGCLCDGNVSCFKVAFRSVIHFTEPECTVEEDIAEMKGAVIALISILSALIGVPILFCCICLGVCCFCTGNKNNA